MLIRESRILYVRDAQRCLIYGRIMNEGENLTVATEVSLSGVMLTSMEIPMKNVISIEPLHISVECCYIETVTGTRVVGFLIGESDSGYKITTLLDSRGSPKGVTEIAYGQVKKFVRLKEDEQC